MRQLESWIDCDVGTCILRDDEHRGSPRDLSTVQQNCSLEATESNAPKRVSRKGKEREIADEGGNQSEVNLVANQRPGTEKKVNGKDEVMQTEKEDKPLSSSQPQPKPKLESTSSRRIVVEDDGGEDNDDDDDNEETDTVKPHHDLPYSPQSQSRPLFDIPPITILNPTSIAATVPCSIQALRYTEPACESGHGNHGDRCVENLLVRNQDNRARQAGREGESILG